MTSKNDDSFWTVSYPQPRIYCFITVSGIHNNIGRHYQRTEIGKLTLSGKYNDVYFHYNKRYQGVYPALPQPLN